MQDKLDSYSGRDDLAATVNSHCLQQLLTGAAGREVRVGEVVLNAAGIKLLRRVRGEETSP